MIGRRLSGATSGGRTRRSYIEKSGVLVGTKNVAYKRHYRSSDVELTRGKSLTRKQLV